MIKMTLVIANFCSVYNKEAELDAFLSYNDVDILLGTESHLDTSVFNSEIFPDFYNIYNRNRHGGGVFIMVKDNLPTSEIISESPLEIVWAKVHTKSKDDLIIGSFYCPPNSPLTVFDELAQNLDDIKEKYPHSKIIIAGDFNRPGIDWEHDLLLTDIHI